MFAPHPDLPELENFSERVVWIVHQIPEGKLATYSQLAFYAGKPKAQRAAGNALKKGAGLESPWHRVLNAKGVVSGESTRATTQRERLAAEGLLPDDRFRFDLEEAQWEPEVTFWQEVA